MKGTHFGQWIYEKEWHPQTGGQNHFTSLYGRVIWHWETSMKARCLFFTQMKLSEGNFSLCIENKNGTRHFWVTYQNNTVIKTYGLITQMVPSIPLTNVIKVQD